jgi:N-acetylglucosamine-6-phosphate deacetylase
VSAPLNAYRIVAGIAADARSAIANAVVSIADGRIAEVRPMEPGERLQSGDLDCRDLTLVPGFIDIHVHGGAGRYVMDGDPEGLCIIAEHLAAHGVTGFLSTTVTGSWEQQRQAIETASNAMGYSYRENGWRGAEVLGVHLEGPYINPARKGAQPLEFVREPSIADLTAHTGDLLSAIKVVTLAPEMPGAIELIEFLSSNSIIASIGHTAATYDQVRAGIAAGARHITHCYNAMRQLEGREPGVVGAAMTCSELKAELIWDNIHVHPASCAALIKAKSSAGVILISDGIPGAGMADGFRFKLGDHPVLVENGAARLADGTLAGSLLTLDRAFANSALFDITDRAMMTSYNAAVSLGLDQRKGLLQPGYDADFAFIGSDGRVQRTIVGGHTIYQR